jgi:uncharacterized protein (TIGR02246 family)
MRKIASIIALAVAGTMLGGLPALAADDEGVSVEIREEIRAWSDALEDAFESGDAAALAAMFTEDATISEPLRPTVRGREAIRDYFQYYIEFGIDGFNSRIDELYGDDETVVEIGRNRVYWHGERTGTSRYMCLYKKVDGRWLMHRVVGSG